VLLSIHFQNKFRQFVYFIQNLFCSLPQHALSLLISCESDNEEKAEENYIAEDLEEEYFRQILSDRYKL
jgi:hypothetical protein